MLRILFLIPFWLSLWFFLSPLYAWWATQNWVPVEAIVTYSAVQSTPTRKGVAPTRLVTHYTYSHRGTYYQGFRSGLASAAIYDNLDETWKRQHVRGIGAAITAYMNPNNPAHSLVDRELRWSTLGLSLGFVTVWGLVWWAFFVRKTQHESVHESAAFVSLRFVVLFNAIGWFSFVLAWPQLLVGMSRVWVVAVFPLAGLYLAYLRYLQTPLREAAIQKAASARQQVAAHYADYDTGKQVPRAWSAVTWGNLAFSVLMLFTLWWQFPRSFDGLAAEAARMAAAPVNTGAQKAVIEQFQREAPTDSQPFALEDSAFAFVALGTGTVRQSAEGFVLSSDGLRIQFRADCPSEPCAPIRLVQWMLVVPKDASKPQGAWERIAESAPELIDFSPQAKNDQAVVPAHSIELKALRTGQLSQARLMVGLYNTQQISTYSQSQLIWPATVEHANSAAQPEPSVGSTAVKSQKSLYAALFYADSVQARSHIAQGASPNEVYENGMGTLHVAAFAGCVDCITALVQAGANLRYKVPTYRQENALMMAIRNQQPAAAQKLLELGADPCQTDREGYDALGWVKFYGVQANFGFVPDCKKW
jgi:Protein of unknown function (DUF3592)/Ankyrin repeats (3 copies)